MTNLLRLAAILLCACIAPGAATAERIDVRIGTASLTGVYYPAGNAICRVLERRFGRDVKCEVFETGGSGDNVGLLRSAKVNFAIMQSDVLARAQNSGRAPLAVGALYPEIFQIVYRSSRNIRKATDIFGIPFSVGLSGSGTRRALNALLLTMDESIASFSHASELHPNDEVSAFCNGRIDGFLFFSGVPNSRVAAAIRDCGGTIAGFERRTMAQFVNERPGYKYFRFRKNAYEGMDETVDTFAVTALLVAGPETPDGLVKLVLESLLDDINWFTRLHPAWSELLEADMATEIDRRLMHPAAAEVYVGRAIIGE